MRDEPKKTILGHPAGLFVLFFSEMWERFCYYGMRALLILYLTKSLLKGDSDASLVYGAYTALIYLAPVVGGQVADRLLGYRRAVILGGILMSIGEFIILGGGESALYIGMGFIIVGNGYFKANISTMVGRLYAEGDPRRDSGFTIFYMGINVGALLAGTVCAGVGEAFGYQYGFGLAGVGMIIGLIVFIRGLKWLEGHGLPPDPAYLHGKAYGLSRFHLCIVLSVSAVPFLYWLVQHPNVVEVLLYVAFVGVCGMLLRVGHRSGDVVQRDRIFSLIALMVFNIGFWACFEQAGTSLTLFADRSVDRTIDSIGWELPASVVSNSFNSGFIILFGPIFSLLWLRLEARGRNPSIPIKFALGLVQLGLGFLVILLAASMAGADSKVPLVFLVLMYMLHTTGELCISPIGLSMVTKLAPKSMTGTVMGAWFLTFSLGNFLAGKIAAYTGAEIDGDAMTPPQLLDRYTGIYGNVGWVLLGIGALLLLLSGQLRRWMHGVK